MTPDLYELYSCNAGVRPNEYPWWTNREAMADFRATPAGTLLKLDRSC